VPVTAPAPGYDRIAQAIETACEVADVSLDVHSGLNLYSPAQGYQRLARILDKAGLIDWSAFTVPVTADGDTEETR
jgi:hypothetical protein